MCFQHIQVITDTLSRSLEPLEGERPTASSFCRRQLLPSVLSSLWVLKTTCHLLYGLPAVAAVAAVLRRLPPTVAADLPRGACDRSSSSSSSINSGSMTEVALKVAMACQVSAFLPRCVSCLLLVCTLKASLQPAPPATHPPSSSPPPPLEQGCVGAVKRVAEALPGVESVDIDLAAQKVVVKGPSLDPAAVKEGVAKSGKATEFWQ